ncbi:MAG TPA: oligosaccharide flippase family protein, partial [Polyangiaceae bacterium]|nr:oligosaccharide flippase family protein [Polyangiaceae bacterium]
QTDDLLIGRSLGAAPLGLYTRAYSTVMMPVHEVGGVLGRVMFPTLSKLQRDLPEMKRLYLRVVGATALLTFPAMALLFVIAEPLTLVLFGDQWLGIVSVLRIYAVVGAFQSVAGTVSWIYKACGRTDLMFRWGIVSSIVTVIAIVVGMRFGSIEAIAIAYGVALVFVLSYPHFAIPGRLIGVSPLDVARTVVGLAAAALLMGGVAYGLGKLTLSLPKGLDLALRISSGGVVYLTCLKLLRVPVYLELRGMARARLLAWAGADAEASAGTDTDEPSKHQSK